MGFPQPSSSPSSLPRAPPGHQHMADRIIGMRSALRSRLEGLGSPLSWHHMTDQIGMFCFTGLTPAQCDRLLQKHHVYLTRNGRIRWVQDTATAARVALQPLLLPLNQGC